MKTDKTVAVGVVIIAEGKKVLIAKRKADKPMPNKWEFPGGKLERNETLEACGIREIKEELEVDIEIDEYVGYEDISYKDKEFCLHLYTGYLQDRHQELILNEHTELAWVAYEEFSDYDFPASKLSFMKKLKNILDENAQ